MQRMQCTKLPTTGAAPTSKRERTHAKATGERFSASVRLCAPIVDAAPLAFVAVGFDGDIQFVNLEGERLFGYTRQEIVGRSIELLVPEASRAAHIELRKAYAASPETRPMGAGRELYVRRKDGTRVPVEIALKPIEFEEVSFILAVVVDITERKRLEGLSREDALTGLLNRRAFDERLGDEIRRAQRMETSLAIAMLDIDVFKQVNDRFGHAAGDAVLREVGNLLHRECRAIDIISRYGGEEFALALPGSDLQVGLTLCERIRQAFCSHDWTQIAPGLVVTISAGVSAWTNGMRPVDLLAAADSSLYDAKRSGRNCVRPQAPESLKTVN